MALAVLKTLAWLALPSTWVLVTSALRLPRVVAALEAAGRPVVPCPVGFRTTGSVRWWVSADVEPSASNRLRAVPSPAGIQEAQRKRSGSWEAQGRPVAESG